MVQIKEIETREYQVNILKTATSKNTLIILPTGTGKTIIALMVAVDRLNKFPDSKVFVLAPTRPLVNQHKNTFSKFLDDIDKTRLVVVTGDTSPELRKNKYKFGKIIFVTPQTLQNDLIQNRVNLSDVSLMVFDEAHRAVGKYPYVFIAKKYIEQSKYPRIIGLTASPGHSLERIKTIIDNLYIEAIEIRTGKELDIRKYIKPINIEWIKVEFGEKEKFIDKLLRDAFDIRISKLKELGIISRKPKGKKEILELVKELREKLAEDPRDQKVKEGIKLIAELVKIEHAIELFETQTYYTFIRYIEKLLEKEAKSTALKNVKEDIRIRRAYALVKELLNEGKEHPKINKLLSIVNKYNNKKIIIFAQIRDTVRRIYEILQNSGYRCKIFTGRSEMKREEQIRVLDEFEKGKFNILIATSVGEEGIDIPKVDLVIFYEPVPSEIRYIQRRGRTGRGEIGEVKILITRGTRDESFMWVSIMRERKMIRNIKLLKQYIKQGKLSIINNTKQVTMGKLSEFAKRFQEYKIKKENTSTTTRHKQKKIIADYREKESGVVQELVKDGYFVELRNLYVGDYIAGEYVIERKSIDDFINSIIDGRLKEQLSKLKTFEKCFLIIEGEKSPYVLSNLQPNYIRALILSILTEYGIPIIWSRSYKDTAKYIELLAERKTIQHIKFEKKNLDEEDIKIRILTAIPGIGEKLAKELLNKFGSIYKIITAPLPELEKVVGEKKARKIKSIFGSLIKEKSFKEFKIT